MNETSPLNNGGDSGRWRIVVMAFISNFIGIGIGFYAFGVFFKPLAEHFNWSRALVAWGPGVGLLISAIYAPRVGNAADKYGMRPLLIGGSITVAISLVMLGFMRNFWQFILFWGVVFSIANIHLGDIVTGSAVARAYPEKRGAAIGLAAVGVSFGGVAMPPFAQWVIDNWGWRVGFGAMGMTALALVCLPAVFFMRGVKETPAQIEDCADESDIECAVGPEKSWTRAEALRSSRFWKMIAVFGLGYLPLGTMLVQQVPFLTDMGIPATRAAWVLSFTAAMGMVGKVFWGSLFDRFEGRWTIACSFAMQAFSIWWLLRAETLLDTIIFGLFFGLGMGGTVPMHTAMRVRQFGPRYLGAIMGVSSPAIMLAQAGGGPLAGWIFDTTGTYRAAFYFFIVCYLLGILVILTLRDPDRTQYTRVALDKEQASSL